VAVCVTEVEALCVVGEELLTEPDGAQAFDTWLRTYVDHVRAKHGLAAAFSSSAGEDSSFVPACRAPVEEIGGALLARAIDDGAVRPDVELAEITTPLNATAMATESTQDAAQTERLLGSVVNGIAQSTTTRTGRPSPQCRSGA